MTTPYNGEERRKSMDADIQEIKLNIALIAKDMSTTTEHIAGICERCKKHTEAIYGNGKPGILTDLDGLKKWREGSVFWRGVVVMLLITMISIGWNSYTYSLAREKELSKIETQVNINTERWNRVLAGKPIDLTK